MAESTYNTLRFKELEAGESITLHQLSSLQLLGGDCLLENSKGTSLTVYNGEQLTNKFYHHTWDQLTLTAHSQHKVSIAYSTVQESASPILSPSFYEFTADDSQNEVFYQLKNIRFLQLLGGDYEIRNSLNESITMRNGQQLPDVFYRQYWDELAIRPLTGNIRMIYIANSFEALP